MAAIHDTGGLLSPKPPKVSTIMAQSLHRSVILHTLGVDPLNMFTLESAVDYLPLYPGGLVSSTIDSTVSYPFDATDMLSA